MFVLSFFFFLWKKQCPTTKKKNLEQPAKEQCWGGCGGDNEPP